MIKTYLTLKTQLGKPVDVDGTEFMVFPVTMLVEGVHHAANGPPAYYPASVLADNLEAWEGAAVTINHPQSPDGTYISAKSPGVLACGSVKNPSHKGKKLKAQVYVKPDAVDQAHLEAMKAGNMEVSTGVYVKYREEKGKWNGEPYEIVMEKIYPDHLALLPEDRGACSQDDGCGIRANVEDVTAMTIRHNSKVADEEPAWSSVDKTELPRLAFADMGEEDLKSTWKYPHHWVSGDTMYLHRGGLNAAWAAANGARSGQEASAEVKAHLQAHRDALGLKANECCPDKVAAVIQANKNFSGDDAEWLMGLSSSQLDKLIPKEEKMQTLQEFIESAPEHLRGPLANAVATEEAVRHDLITKILSNGESGLTAEQLKGIDIGALKGIAKLATAKPAEPNYSLANGGGVPSAASQNIEEPLVMTGLFQGGAN